MTSSQIPCEDSNNEVADVVTSIPSPHTVGVVGRRPGALGILGSWDLGVAPLLSNSSYTLY